MIIKKKTTKPVTREFAIDRIEILTYHGSQSTDYGVKLFSDYGKKLVHEEDVHSIEDGIKYLISLLPHPKECRCQKCIEGMQEEEETYEN